MTVSKSVRLLLQYTFFASGEPLVNDAVVILTNHQRGIRIEQTTEERNGRVLFTYINKDRYELFIEAPDHRSLQQIVVTSFENPTITVFLERQAVTIYWSVTPVAFEESYSLTVEVDFETHVPITVVTVTPTDFDLDEIELGFIDSLQLNITNHGLIRPNDLEIILPDNHPSLEFSASNDVLGNLEPLSSITVVVRISRKSVNKRGVQVSGRSYSLTIIYSYVYGIIQFRHVSVALVSRQGRIFNAKSCTGCPGSGYINFVGGFIAGTNSFCNLCLQSLIGCISTPSFPLLGCFPMILSGSRIKNAEDALRWIGCDFNVGWINKVFCINDVYINCLSSGPSLRKKRSLLGTVENHLEGMYPIDLSKSLAVEVLGDSLWLSVGDSQWLSHVLEPALDKESENGVLLSATEISAILATGPPNGTTIGDVQRMVERFNNTLSGWNSGQLEPVNGSNIASFTIVERLSNDSRTYNQIAVDKGFSSYLEAYTVTTSDINQLSAWEEEEGVCAVVRIRIEQEVAVTREAFLARLEIENQEDSNLEQMNLEFIITDTNNGEISTHRFSIGNETLSGSLNRVGNAWMLTTGESGAVEWLIVPLSEAAPQTDHFYTVGGTLR